MAGTLDQRKLAECKLRFGTHRMSGLTVAELCRRAVAKASAPAAHAGCLGQPCS
jgi:hypothetical protein